jgi:transposase
MIGEGPEVRLSWKEQQKLKVLQEILARTRSQVSGAAALGVSDRWIRTLLKRLRSRGVSGLAHGNRGRVPSNRLQGSVAERIVELYREGYDGFNLTHFREMLLEREGLRAPSRESIRKILMAAGVWERQRTRPEHRQRRPRRELEGELLQMDASIHRWLGPEGPFWALVGAIDDATGDVPSAKFFMAETREAYFEVLEEIGRRKGLPQAVYTDRDSVFVVNTIKDREALVDQGKLPRTQFGRALKELGIEWIPAYSPQAKGRVERLWGTFQDRLANELKLAKVSTLEQANAYLRREFLPRFNRQFRRSAARPDLAYRPAPSPSRLRAILCWKETRKLARDHTFQVEGRSFQVLPHERLWSLTGRTVEVRRTFRGSLEAWYGLIRLSIRPAPSPPPRAPRLARGAAPAPPGAAWGREYRTRGKVRL